MTRDPLVEALREALREWDGDCFALARAAREHIAAEIDERAAMDFGCEWRDGMEDAARIARGQA